MKGIITEEKRAKYNERCRMAVDVIANNPEIIPLLKDKYTTDDVLEDALDINPDIFRHIKDPSIRLISKALDMDGSNIQFVSKDKLKSLPEEVLISAMDSTDDIEADININLNDMSEEFKMDMFVHDPVKALQCGISVPEYFIIKELEKTPNLIRHIKNPTTKMKCVALEHEPNVAVYFDKLTDEMMDIIDTKYPHLKDSLSTYTRNKEGGSK